MSTPAEPYDVAICGYGPVGQVAAILLGSQGRRVAIFDRFPDVYPLPRAVHYDDETARILQAADLGDELAEIVDPAMTYHWRNAAGETLLFFDWTVPGPSGWPKATLFCQPELQRVLDRAVRRLPTVDVRLGEAVVDVEDRGDTVALTTRPTRFADGELELVGEPRTTLARWAIGADGANSLVRERMDVTVTDLGFAFDWLIADVIPLEERIWNPAAVQLCDPTRPTTKVPGGPGRRRWEWMLLPGESADDFAADDAVWKLLARDDVTPTNARLERHVVYSFRARWADAWRRGRLLLAGDAAHLMPPFAGQGLCAGLRDALQLAWRLGLVLDGRAPDALLDAYEVERIAHVRHAIDLSVQLGRVICIADPEEAARRDARMISGQDRGPERTASIVPRLGSPGTFRDEDPHAGVRFVQGRVALGTREGLFDDVVGRGFVLLAWGADTGERVGTAAREALAVLGGRVVAVVGAEALTVAENVVRDLDGVYERWFREAGVTAVLVRPDFYVFGTATSAERADALVTDLLARLGAVGTPA